MRFVLYWIAMLGLVMAPTAYGQDDTGVRQDILAKDGTTITFYGHIFGTGEGAPMPMNTQYPHGEEDYSIGARSGGCNWPPGATSDAPSPVGGGECTAETIFFYTTAGFVQVKDYTEWGGDYSKFHNERGQTKDIYLDTSRPANATLHMSADAHGWPVAACDAWCWNWDPGYFPDWTVEVWVWHASLGDWSSDPSARPNMEPIIARSPAAIPIAHGKSVPADTFSFDPTIPVLGGQTVWPFTAELEWDPAFVASGGVVPYLNDLIVEFQAFEEDEDGNRYLFPGMVWNTNSGEDYPNTVILPVRNPLDVELVFPRFVHDKLVILSIINTPWGSYDIDPDLTTITVEDSRGRPVDIDESTMIRSLDSSVAHSGHYKPINVTWVWDYQAQGLAPDDYKVTVSATNFQHSYQTETSASFKVAADGSGRDAIAGRSGLQSYSQDDFEAFNQGAGQTVRADPEDIAAAEDGSSEKAGAPGGALLLGILAMAAVVGRRQRRA